MIAADRLGIERRAAVDDLLDHELPRLSLAKEERARHDAQHDELEDGQDREIGHAAGVLQRLVLEESLDRATRDAGPPRIGPRVERPSSRLTRSIIVAPSSQGACRLSARLPCGHGNVRCRDLLARRLRGHDQQSGKLFFDDAGITKLDLVNYYLAVATARCVGVRDRPMALKRFVDGAEGEAFFQKRAPKSVPEFVRTVELSFPSGRTADEVVVDNRAALAWVVNLGCIDLNPHPVRGGDLDHPDELRVDLDPGPGVRGTDVRRVALVVPRGPRRSRLHGWPKTSGSRGIHVYVRIEPRWSFAEVRRAALALAREVERRAPELATSKWWKEERHGVFLDYNQNAKDRTVASVYSVRPRPAATVCAPLTWDEVPDAELDDFTLRDLPDRYARLGRRRRGDRRRGALARAAPRALGAPRGRGPGRRAVAAELRQAARRAAAGAALEPPHAGRGGAAPTDPKAPRGRAGSVAPAMPSPPARNPDGTVPPTGRRRSTQPLLVISQAAARPMRSPASTAGGSATRGRGARPRPGGRAGRRDARPLQGLVAGPRQPAQRPEDLRPAAEPPDPDYDPWTA